MTSRYIRRADAARVLRRGEAAVRALREALNEQVAVRCSGETDEAEARDIIREEIDAVVAALDALNGAVRTELDGVTITIPEDHDNR